MLKNSLIAVSVFAVLLLLALSIITTRYIDQEEINRAQQERLRLKASRDSIYAVVATRDSMQALLQSEVSNLKERADDLRNEVRDLEAKRQATQLSIRRLNSRDELEKKLIGTFPEFQGALRITEEFNEEEQVGIEYLSIPIWFSEAFMIDHENSLNYQQQRDSLLFLDQLQQQVIALKDSIFDLERANKLAFQQGFDTAMVKYDSLSLKYEALLRKPPQIKFGLPQLGAVAIGTAAGFVGGVLVTK